MRAPAFVEEGVPLAPRTTLGVGGPARFYAEAAREEDVAEALAWAGARGLATLVLGAGSNLLVADRGFDGLVLRPLLRGVTIEPGGATARIEAGAGEPWDDLVARAVGEGLAGVECLSGIPGDVGATPIQNVGAYGQEVSETIVRVRTIERATGRTVELDRGACGFGYRDSVFKREAKDRHVITRVTFELVPGGAPAVRYAELQRRLAGRTSSSSTFGTSGPQAALRPEPSLAEVRAAVVELRRGKSMVLDPADPNTRSAGSFFMNPTLDAAAFEAARARVEAAGVLAPGEAMPSFPAEGGRVKLAAAWLIERAGFDKGWGEGRAGLSTRHTLAIVNRGGATAADVVALARRVQDGVRARFGVALRPEPVMVGFAPDELAGLA